MSHTIDHDVFEVDPTSILMWYSVSHNGIKLADVLAVSAGDAVVSARDVFGHRGVEVGAFRVLPIDGPGKFSKKIVITEEAKARAMIIMEKDG